MHKAVLLQIFSELPTELPPPLPQSKLIVTNPIQVNYHQSAATALLGNADLSLLRPDAN